ncbi:reverse transcriptase [Tanacetum coccineum]
MTELKNLRYGNNMKEYQSQFEQLLTQVDITVSHSVSMFIAGLPTSMEMNVRMFRPKTLADAFSLANFQEASLVVIRQKTVPLLPTLKIVTKHLASPNPVPRKHPLEEDNDLSLEETLNEVDTMATEESELLMSECYLQISLNALSRFPTFNTMRMKDIAAKHVLHLLLDTGSTHNFLDLFTAKKLGCKMKKTCPLGTKQSELQWMTEKQLSKQVIGRSDPYFSTINCLWPSASLNLMQTIPDPNTPSDSALSNLLQEFEDFFAMPTGLPLQRSFDHRIPLKDASIVVNIRPYRYPPKQKDVIEQMINELLDTGVVRHSHSPFSSPIVMVKRRMVLGECVYYRKLNKDTIKDSYYVLQQKGHPIAFLNITLAPKHQFLSAYEKELLAEVTTNEFMDAVTLLWTTDLVLSKVLQPLPIPTKIWHNISMDFVDALLNYCSALLDHIYKLYGLPKSIVNDRDKVFMSLFWQSLLKMLQVHLKMSTAYHPQPDGQTEVVNKCFDKVFRIQKAFGRNTRDLGSFGEETDKTTDLHQHLSILCYQQLETASQITRDAVTIQVKTAESPKDWTLWLSLAEYWYNINYYSAIKTTRFEAVYGQPRALHILYVAKDSIIELGDRTLQEREKAIEMLQFNLKKAQDRMKSQADKHRSERNLQSMIGFT